MLKLCSTISHQLRAHKLRAHKIQPIQTSECVWLVPKTVPWKNHCRSSHGAFWLVGVKVFGGPSSPWQQSDTVTNLHVRFPQEFSPSFGSSSESRRSHSSPPCWRQRLRHRTHHLHPPWVRRRFVRAFKIIACVVDRCPKPSRFFYRSSLRLNNDDNDIWAVAPHLTLKSGG